jgi:hypothetical protein
VGGSDGPECTDSSKGNTPMTSPPDSIPPATPPQARPRKKATWKGKLSLLGGSLLFCLALLLLGEAYCRWFLDINFQGNSQELFIGQAFGPSMGNARNAQGVSFGADVWTDANGFRHDPTFEETNDQPAVLILGDSVAFGVGVDEAQTFAGLLRRKGAGTTTVYNSAVIGYALPDYKNVVTHFLPQHPEIKRVYLAMCLNDISHESASDIEAFLHGQGEDDAVGTIKGLPVIHQLHGFLRSHSKLYLALKNALTDPSERYFRHDLARYGLDEATFNARMQPVLDIAEELRKRGVELTVVIEPCEPQLRSTDPALDVPQKRLGEYFRKHEIRWIDPLPAFRQYPGNRSKLYLSGDAMHFSAAGHQLFFEQFFDTIGREMQP